jgi:hypothetical protein
MWALGDYVGATSGNVAIAAAVAGAKVVASDLAPEPFALDHQAVGDELLRVCRPGGVTGMICWPVDGFSAEFLAVFAMYAPPAPSAASPLQWAPRNACGCCSGPIQLARDHRHALIVDHFDDPAQLCQFYSRPCPLRMPS